MIEYKNKLKRLAESSNSDSLLVWEIVVQAYRVEGGQNIAEDREGKHLVVTTGESLDDVREELLEHYKGTGSRWFIKTALFMGYAI